MFLYCFCTVFTCSTCFLFFNLIIAREPLKVFLSSGSAPARLIDLFVRVKVPIRRRATPATIFFRASTVPSRSTFSGYWGWLIASRRRKMRTAVRRPTSTCLSSIRSPTRRSRRSWCALRRRRSGLRVSERVVLVAAAGPEVRRSGWRRWTRHSQKSSRSCRTPV